MVDREKVTYGLRCMCYGDVECKECPYARNGSGWHDCRSNCAKDALALNKEQEKARLDIAHEMVSNSILMYQGKEIVRCKDCMHGDPCNDGEIYCEKDIGTFITAVHKPDWFCADGERKDT